MEVERREQDRTLHVDDVFGSFTSLSAQGMPEMIHPSMAWEGASPLTVVLRQMVASKEDEINVGKEGLSRPAQVNLSRFEMGTVCVYQGKYRYATIEWKNVTLALSSQASRQTRQDGNKQTQPGIPNAE